MAASIRGAINNAINAFKGPTQAAQPQVVPQQLNVNPELQNQAPKKDNNNIAPRNNNLPGGVNVQQMANDALSHMAANAALSQAFGNASLQQSANTLKQQQEQGATAAIMQNINSLSQGHDKIIKKGGDHIKELLG